MNMLVLGIARELAHRQLKAFERLVATKPSDKRQGMWATTVKSLRAGLGLPAQAVRRRLIRLLKGFHKVRTARKAWTCEECDCAIPAGSSYVDTWNGYKDMAVHTRYCMTCAGKS
jgi:hypothetical protein